MKVKDFLKAHANEYIHIHWEGFDPKTSCVGLDAYSTNQDLSVTYGEKEIDEWYYTTEMHYDKDWNYVPMRVLLILLAEC